MKNVVCITCLLAALLGPAQAFAEISIFVSHDGDGCYILEGDNAQGVEALDLSIGYDTASLANPAVEAQGGAVTGVYENTPGLLNVMVMRANPDTSFELHLKFDRKGDSPGVIHSVSAVARDKDGRSYAASSDLRALSPQLTSRANGDGEDPGAGAPTAKMISFDKREKSVLQRFREFKGEKGLKAFAVLFQHDQGTRIEQEPAIALSDGKTPVVVRLELQAPRVHSPDIALSGVELVSLQRIDERNWFITMLPGEGVWEARLILGAGEEMIDFPLVLAPPVELADGVKEKDFLAALNRYLANQAARRGGKSDPCRDEYIFTANYLAGLATSTPDKTSH
jgi:hypothetical protein